MLYAIIKSPQLNTTLSVHVITVLFRNMDYLLNKIHKTRQHCHCIFMSDHGSFRIPCSKQKQFQQATMEGNALEYF